MEIMGPSKPPSWSSLICEYARYGKMELALSLYQKIQEFHPPEHTPGPTFVALLKACAALRDLRRGHDIQTCISKLGLIEKDPFVGCAVVHMYAKCGSFLKAEEVFDRITFRDVVSWNSMMSGYVEHGRGAEALQCFGEMQIECILPTHVSYICGLKACGISKDVVKGSYMHSQIEKEGMLENNACIGTSLVDMYLKCGRVVNAKVVFDMLPVRNVVLWTSLISGFADNAFAEEALEAFEIMRIEGVSPNAVTFTCTLKVCGIKGTIEKGQEIHMDLVRKGLLERDILVGNSLIDMYVKCGMLNTAQKVFEQLPFRDTVSWNILIMGYTEQGDAKQALEFFGQMQLENVSPDTLTYIYSLKACSAMRAICIGSRIFSEVARTGLFEHDVHLGNNIVDMFIKWGMFERAQEVFDKLLVKDVVSWNTLMAGYADHGLCMEALSCFSQMQDRRFSPDSCSFVCIINACGYVRMKEEGEEIHSEVEKVGLVECDLVVGNSLVDMYARLGLHYIAHIMFDRLPIRSIITWNTLISGYVEDGYAGRALDCFKQMQLEGMFPDGVTFVCVLKACGSIGAEELGKEIHVEIARKGLLEIDVTLGNALLDMYAKSGLLTQTQEVFDKLPIHDTVTWNSLILSYAESGYCQKALGYFRCMQEEHNIPDDITLVCVLGTCCSIGAISMGQEIHTEIIRYGIWEKDLLVGSALVDMYAKYGMLAEAHKIFQKLPSRDVACWNSLISGYIDHERCIVALDCVERMQHDHHVCLDVVTFAYALKACSSLGVRIKGEQLHFEIVKLGFLESDIVIGNNLIDMYAKCGSVEEAKRVFEKLHIRDTGSWNALISGYDQLGDGDNVLGTFDKMISESIKPDRVTFLIVLNTCNRQCLYAMGEKYFDTMIEYYGIIPTLEHHTAKIDLLGQSGQLEKMMHMIKQLPFSPDAVVWHAMLSACRKWGHVELARGVVVRSRCLEENGITILYRSFALRLDVKGSKCIIWCRSV